MGMWGGGEVGMCLGGYAGKLVSDHVCWWVYVGMCLCVLPRGAHAHSGVKQSVLSVYLSVSGQEKLKCPLNVRFTALSTFIQLVYIG